MLILQEVRKGSRYAVVCSFPRFGKYEESIISICSPILKWLYKKTGKAVILATIKKDQKFIIIELWEINIPTGEKLGGIFFC